jgi:hypothetical protein
VKQTRISGVFIMFEKLLKNKKKINISKATGVGQNAIYFTDAEWLSVAAIYSVIEPIARVALSSQKMATGMIPVGILTTEQIRCKYKFCKANLRTSSNIPSPDGSNKRPKTESSTFMMVDLNLSVDSKERGDFPRKRIDYKHLDPNTQALCDCCLVELKEYFKPTAAFTPCQLLQFAVHPLFVWIGLNMLSKSSHTRNNIREEVQSQLVEELVAVGAPLANNIVNRAPCGDNTDANNTTATTTDGAEEELDDDDDYSLYDDLLVQSQSQDVTMPASAQEDFENKAGEVVNEYFAYPFGKSKPAFDVLVENIGESELRGLLGTKNFNDLKTKLSKNSNNSPDRDRAKLLGKHFVSICGAFDLEKWWKSDGSAHWQLIAEGVACRIIAAPDTNAFQERIFSEVKNFMRPRRNRLDMAKFEAQILLASNCERVKSVLAQAKKLDTSATTKMTKRATQMLMTTASLTASLTTTQSDELVEEDAELVAVDEDEQKQMEELMDFLLRKRPKTVETTVSRDRLMVYVTSVTLTLV